MSDFLASMAAASHQRLIAARAVIPEAALREQAKAHKPPAPLVRSGFDLIAEIKWRSPSAGRLRSPGDGALEAVSTRARSYERAGAAALSVLTEPARFGGALEHLTAAARAVSIPALRKDFLVDPYQILEARAAGASGVLLITRMLDDLRLSEMLDAAAEWGMFVLLEAFDAVELDRAGQAASSTDAEVLVGLNARNLVTLAVDPDRLDRLADRFPPGFARVAESGLLHPDDAGRLASLGYDAALVGSALMTATSPETLVADMIRAGRHARGKAEDPACESE